MAITKDSVIYEALLAVNGGVVTPNMSTRYGEAEEFLAYAFNYAQLGTYWVEGKAEMEHVINPQVLTPFDNLPIQYDATRQRYYGLLPAPVVPLSKGRALEISTESGKRFIPLTQGDDAMQEYYEKYDKQLKYQIEGNSKVWFWGLKNSPLLKYFRAKYIVQVADLPGDAPILLAADGYKVVLDLLIAFLTGERKMPKQYAETGKDLNQLQ
jgi:hypothetical protein